MKRVPTGTLIAGPSLGGETVRAFVPTPLPPDPELTVDIELREEIDQALLALGRLDSVSSLLPDTSLFLYMYVRKEDRERYRIFAYEKYLQILNAGTTEIRA